MVDVATDTPEAARTRAIRSVMRKQAAVVWANRLDSRMAAMRISTQQLADAVGTTYQTIWKMRQGGLYPREYLRVSIAMALGANVEEIFPMPSRTEIASALPKAAA
jgi:DNA-binding XRE family transcriptional regulator